MTPSAAPTCSLISHYKKGMLSTPPFKEEKSLIPHFTVASPLHYTVCHMQHGNHVNFEKILIMQYSKQLPLQKAHTKRPVALHA